MLRPEPERWRWPPLCAICYMLRAKPTTLYIHELFLPFVYIHNLHTYIQHTVQARIRHPASAQRAQGPQQRPTNSAHSTNMRAQAQHGAPRTNTAGKGIAHKQGLARWEDRLNFAHSSSATQVWRAGWPIPKDGAAKAGPLAPGSPISRVHSRIGYAQRRPHADDPQQANSLKDLP